MNTETIDGRSNVDDQSLKIITTVTIAQDPGFLFSLMIVWTIGIIIESNCESDCHRYLETRFLESGGGSPTARKVISRNIQAKISKQWFLDIIGSILIGSDVLES